MNDNRNGEQSIGRILWYGNEHCSKFLVNLVNQEAFHYPIHYNVYGWFIVEEV